MRVQWGSGALDERDSWEGGSKPLRGSIFKNISVEIDCLCQLFSSILEKLSLSSKDEIESCSKSFSSCLHVIRA